MVGYFLWTIRWPVEERGSSQLWRASQLLERGVVWDETRPGRMGVRVSWLSGVDLTEALKRPGIERPR